MTTTPNRLPDPVPHAQALVASLSARVKSLVLSNLLRVVGLLGRALEGFSPNP